MKLLLTITIIFVYLCGFCQNKKHKTKADYSRISSWTSNDTIGIMIGGSDTDCIYGRLPLGTKIEIDTTQFIIFEQHKNDTSPVIMLICDTSYTNMVGWYLDNKYEYWDYRWETKWWFGYSVIDWGIGERYYLDDKKKRLPASIIVWQTINRK